MFLLNLGAWETLHAADGFIMIAFNNQICNCVKKTAKQATVPAVTLALSVASRKSNFSSLKHGDRWLQLFEQNKLQTNKGILSRRHE
uniref:HTH CENPB-type domain-containing protein n=1 Tax=Setaria digitata TaxID=48799 RepID=A0A915Q7M6_9BILA